MREGWDRRVGFRKVRFGKFYLSIIHMDKKKKDKEMKKVIVDMGLGLGMKVDGGKKAKEEAE